MFWEAALIASLGLDQIKKIECGPGKPGKESNLSGMHHVMWHNLNLFCVCVGRGNLLSENDSKKATSDGHGLTGKIVIDGMDQSKFKCPRNLASNSQFSECWRPSLHIHPLPDMN